MIWIRLLTEAWQNVCKSLEVSLTWVMGSVVLKLAWSQMLEHLHQDKSIFITFFFFEIFLANHNSWLLYQLYLPK